MRKLKTIPKKKLTYPQAKLRFPKLRPFGDADKDGKKNWIDCRPFNKKKQDSGFEELKTWAEKNVDKIELDITLKDRGKIK